MEGCRILPELRDFLYFNKTRGEERRGEERRGEERRE